MPNNPVPHIPFNSLIAPQMQALQEIAQRANDSAFVAGPTGQGGAIGVTQGPHGIGIDYDVPITKQHTFPVVLVDTGPNDEDDYDDGRYWARSVIPAQAAGAKGTDAATLVIDTSQNGFWGTVFNFAELASDNHELTTYSSSPDEAISGDSTIVWVTQVHAGKHSTDPEDHANALYMFNASTSETGFWAQVGSATLYSGQQARWTYQLTEVDDKQWLSNGGVTVKEDGRVVTGKNNIESGNPTSGVGTCAPGWTISQDEFDSGVKLLPIQGSPVVWVTKGAYCNDGGVIYQFDADNIKGECPS